RVCELPTGAPWRRAALVEMVRIDLRRQWQQGHQVHLEAYLMAYPELGTKDTVSTDLIEVEYQVRQEFGKGADWREFASRFPGQAEELRGRLEKAAKQMLGPESANAAARPVEVTDPTPDMPAPKAGPPLPEQF